MLKYTNRRYGAYLSKEEVAELVAPHPDTLDLVTAWLSHYGVCLTSVSTTPGGHWLIIAAVPVDQANALLNASYQLYRHLETKEIVLRTIHYSLPKALSEYVQAVTPTTYFGSSSHALRQTSTLHTDDLELHNARAYDSSLTSCSEAITPTCLRALYNTSTYVPSATESNQLGIAGFADQFVSYQDLTKFMLQFRPDAAGANFTVEQVNGGGNKQSNPGIRVRIVHILRGCRDVK